MLFRSGDEWFETEQRPDIVINKEGNFDATVATMSAAGSLGTIWNAWQTQWTGKTVGSGKLSVEHNSGQKWSAEEWAISGGIWATEAYNSLDAAGRARVDAARDLQFVDASASSNGGTF